MRNIYTVGQVNRYIRGLFTSDGYLSGIYVRGEVSNCKYHSSGHIYFSLKDQTGTISCVMFAGDRRGLTFRMKDGDSVVVGGRVDVYERDGRYQLYAKEIEPEGEGVLAERFNRLKKRLEAEGLFDPSHKKQIPKYAQTIGVVTAPTGAAVRDIQNISHRRNPYVQVILYPALVQGDGAKDSIVNGIRALDGHVDILIVGRGGGSMEDLWAFNEEAVARAIYECETPVISAVGHQTDTTIADFVADRAAPTPSAAAELAVYDALKLSQEIRTEEQLLERAFRTRLTRTSMKADWYTERFRGSSPSSVLMQQKMRASDYDRRYADLFKTRLDRAGRKAEEQQKTLRMLMPPVLDRARKRADSESDFMKRNLRAKLEHRTQEFLFLLTKYEAANPLKRLQSGYSYLENENHHAVKSVSQLSAGDQVHMYLADGIVSAEVLSSKKKDWSME